MIGFYDLRYSGVRLKARDIPNILTIMRILLVAPIVWLLLEEKFMIALSLFFIAGLSDGLDGFLAKQFDWSSRLGAFLDPLADKLLLICSVLALGWLGLLPIWLVLIVLIRDIIIMSGALTYYFRISKFDAKPSIISKINTFSQILLVLLIITNQVLVMDLSSLIQGLILVVAVTISWSGFDYVLTWGKRARDFNLPE